MGDFVFNIAKGRVVEWYNRVESNDPTNAAFILTLWTGVETDGNLEDIDDLAAIEAGTLAESVATNYVRKTLESAELDALPAPDDSNNRYDVDLPDTTWTAIGNGANSVLTRMIVVYDSDTTGGADANIIPACGYDFSVTTDGSDLTVQFAAQGFFSAT